jgi:hypothetical protein
MMQSNESRPSLFAREPGDEAASRKPSDESTSRKPSATVAESTAEEQPHSRVDVAAPDPKLAEPSARRNPWLFALWAMAVLLVSVGVWGQLYAIELGQGEHLSYLLGTGDGTTYSAPSVTDFYVLPVVLATFAPWLVAIGLGAAVAATLVHALAWMRRNSS